jgi:hypothetical protein
MSNRTIIVPQGKLEAKRAKLEGTRILLAEKERNKVKYAEIYTLNADKSTVELEATEEELAHFDVLNTPQRDLNPKQLSERLEAQSTIKFHESRILGIRSKITQITNPAWFPEENEEEVEIVEQCDDEALKMAEEPTDEPPDPTKPKEISQITTVAEAMSALNEIKQRNLFGDGNSSHIYYTTAPLYADCIAPHIKEMENVQHHVGALEDAEVLPDTTTLFIIEPVEEPEEPTAEDFPKPNKISQITSEDEAMAAMDEITQQDLSVIGKALHTYSINQELFDEYLVEFIDNQGDSTIQEHVGALSDAKPLVGTRILFVIEPAQPKVPTEEPTPENPAPTKTPDPQQVMVDAIRKYVNADELQKGDVEITLINTFREQFIADNIKDEGVLLNSTIDYNYQKEIMAVVALGTDSDNTHILHSTTYNLIGESTKTVRKEYKRKGSAESYMRKFLGK